MSSSHNISPAFLALAENADTAVLLCTAIVSGRWSGVRELRFICTSAGMPLSQQGLVERILESGSKTGLWRQVSPLMWEPLLCKDSVGQLLIMLEGASAYRQHVHSDANEVGVVLTRPPRPSQLEKALQASGYSYFELEGTGDTFEDMAAKATKRFVVMTPFLDVQGAATVLSLFERVRKGVQCELIVRYRDTVTPPEGLADIAGKLKAIGVTIYNYRLEREAGGGYETFHAKVVLTDNIRCYIGSANMTQSSFAYSMELGVSVQGKAAARIANIVDAIIRVATRVS